MDKKAAAMASSTDATPTSGSDGGVGTAATAGDPVASSTAEGAAGAAAAPATDTGSSIFNAATASADASVDASKASAAFPSSGLQPKTVASGTQADGGGDDDGDY